MANKRKNKNKDAAAKQKAAAAYMSKKNAPVQKAQAPKAATKEADKAKVKLPVEAEAIKTQPVEQKAAKSAPVQRAARSGKPKPKHKKEPLKLKDLRWDRIIAVALVFCALVAGLTALIFWLSTRFTVPKAAIREYRGVNYSATELFEIQADAAEQSRLAGEMKRKGDVKLFEYYAADQLTIPDKGEPGWLNLSNAFNNKYILMATIVDEAGNVCAHTRGIPAGFTLGEITLEYSVPYGTHNMHLVVSAYDIKTREVVGVQHSPLTVQVGIEEEMTDG